MKLVVVVGGIVPSGHAAMVAMPGVVAVTMSVVVAMLMTVIVKIDLCGDLGGQRAGSGAVRQEDDKGRNDERKGGRQRDHTLYDPGRPAMTARRAHALRSL